jgi:transposase-like protein
LSRPIERLVGGSTWAFGRVGGRCAPRLRPVVRSSNGLERAFEEERRRSKVIPHFFAEKPCLKLMYGVMDRVSGR